MIIKSNRIHEANCFGQKIDYILSDKGRAKEVESFEIHQNIRQPNRDGAVKAFQDNDVYRKENAAKKKIKNSIVCYHDILSFHLNDKQHLDEAILRDLTEQYIQIRCPDAVVFAKPHLHNKNLHIHILISGSDYKSKKLTRLSDAKWNKVRKDIEKYQKEQYPELQHSLVYQDIGKRKRKGKAKRKDNERMMRERGAATILDKDLMKKAVLDFFKIANSKAEFFNLVAEHGIETYNRTIKGKEQPYGVLCNGRKMRFSTIGIKKTHFNELDTKQVAEEQKKKFQTEHDEILKEYVNYRRKRPKKNEKTKKKGRRRGRDRDIDFDR